MASARLRSTQPGALPAVCGTTCVSGATVWASGSDVYEAVVDDRGTLSVFLLDLAEPAWAGPAADAVAGALEAASPLHVVVADLASVLREGATHAGLGVIRFVPGLGRVEVLNAGVPPIACVQPDGKVSYSSPRSGPVGLLDQDVHAYDLVPFTWKAHWLLASDGLTGGSLARDAVAELVDGLGGPSGIAPLASETSRSIAWRLTRLVGAVAVDDASLIVVYADPTKSVASGIR